MRKSVSILMLMLLVMCMVVPAFAASEEDVRTGIASGGSNPDTSMVTPNNPNNSVDSTVDGIINDFAPNITTNDIVNRLEQKGNDVVTILQTVGKYVCIGAFIICCILTIAGIIGNPKLLWAGVIGMIVSGLAYAGIVCGREIVNWIATWAIS